MVLILLDTLVNALCLALMLKVTGRRMGLLRIAFSAFAGAIAAFAVRKSGCTRLFAAAIWLPAACLMAGAAGGKRLIRSGCTLLGCYGLVGGTVWALAGALDSLPAAWGIGAAAVCVMALCAVRERHAAADVHTVHVCVTHAGQSAAFSAMVDSGNCLRDYLTHRPVLVLPEAAGRALFGLETASLRPIFADTAGGRLMMGCFTPQRVRVSVQGRAVDVRCVIALSPAMGKNAPALFPPSLLYTGFGDEEGDSYGKAEN